MYFLLMRIVFLQNKLLFNTELIIITGLELFFKPYINRIKYLSQFTCVPNRVSFRNVRILYMCPGASVTDRATNCKERFPMYTLFDSNFIPSFEIFPLKFC